MRKTIPYAPLVALFLAGSPSSGFRAAEPPALTLIAGPTRDLKDITLRVPPPVFQRGVSKWRHGGYIRYGDDHAAPSFYTFDREGNFVHESIVSLSDAIRIEVHDFDRAEDASVVFCATAFGSDGKPASYLGWIRPDGTPSKLVPTTPYFPFQISLAADGSLWTVGQTPALAADGHNIGIDLRASVMRHFDRAGNVIQSFFPSSQFLPSSPRLISGFLTTNADRLGWYSPAAGKSVYVEMSFDGSEIRTYPGLSDDSNRVTGFTLTSTGEAFLTVNRMHQNRADIYHLDRQKSEWVRVDALPSAPPTQELLGSDQETLIFQVEGDRSKLATFSTAPQSASRTQ